MLMDCQMFDPNRGAFDPVIRQMDVTRPGKTREDHMPTAKRPRVIAWQKRLAKMQKGTKSD